MRVRYVDTHDSVGGFQVEAENETERTVLSLFMRANESGMSAHLHSSCYASDYKAVTSILFGLVKCGEITQLSSVPSPDEAV